MNAPGQKFAIVFGLCVIIASLCSGCATGAPSASTVSLYDINYFQPDCRIKEQQMHFLQSLRRGRDDKLFTASGFFRVDDQVNWTIDTHLRYLTQYC